jgi:hypothetical protein
VRVTTELAGRSAVEVSSSVIAAEINVPGGEHTYFTTAYTEKWEAGKRPLDTRATPLVVNVKDFASLLRSQKGDNIVSGLEYATSLPSAKLVPSFIDRWCSHGQAMYEVAFAVEGYVLAAQKRKTDGKLYKRDLIAQDIMTSPLAKKLYASIVDPQVTFLMPALSGSYNDFVRGWDTLLSGRIESQHHGVAVVGGPPVNNTREVIRESNFSLGNSYSWCVDRGTNTISNVVLPDMDMYKLIPEKTWTTYVFTRRVPKTRVIIVPENIPIWLKYKVGKAEALTNFSRYEEWDSYSSDVEVRNVIEDDKRVTATRWFRQFNAGWSPFGRMTPLETLSSRDIFGIGAVPARVQTIPSKIKFVFINSLYKWDAVQAVLEEL